MEETASEPVSATPQTQTQSIKELKASHKQQQLKQLALQNTTEWNSLLHQSRRTRHICFSPTTKIYHVAQYSPLYYKGYRDPNQPANTNQSNHNAHLNQQPPQIQLPFYVPPQQMQSHYSQGNQPHHGSQQGNVQNLNIPDVKNPPVLKRGVSLVAPPTQSNLTPIPVSRSQSMQTLMPQSNRKEMDLSSTRRSTRRAASRVTYYESDDDNEDPDSPGRKPVLPAPGDVAPAAPLRGGVPGAL